MRPIDADALIERIYRAPDLGGWIGWTRRQMEMTLIELIDSSPTIGAPGYVDVDDDYLVSVKDVLNITAETGAMETAIRVGELPRRDRPRGEWLYCEDEHGVDGYRCSHCGKFIPWDYQHKFINFIEEYYTCPFCDARMGDTDDE